MAFGEAWRNRAPPSSAQLTTDVPNTNAVLPTVMLRRLAPRPALLLATVVLLVAAAVWLQPRTSEASTSAAEAALQNRIGAMLDNEQAPNAIWGVYVKNLRTGAVVYSRNADRSMVPASNQKLITSAVALEQFGPDHRFATGLYFDGRAEGGLMRGDLAIRGSGDPSFGSSLWPGNPLADWARGLSAMGVTRIEGRIIGDGTVMAAEQYAAGWDIDYIATAAWAQPIAGLSYADNLVSVQVAGTRAGQEADVTVTPAGYANLRGELSTRSGRGFSPLSIERQLGTNDIVLNGSVTAAYRGTVRLPIDNPVRFTAHAFAEHLRRAGIEVAAEVVDAVELDERPSYGSDPVFVYHSPPLLDILAIINQRSNNFFAEQIFRSTAANGSSRGAAQRAMSFLQGANAPTSGVSIRDGSGLSRKNLITPLAMAGLLEHMYQSEHRDAFLSTLARGGQANSTMRFRLAGVPVWAKTGTIEHVRAISGYVSGPDETPYVFVLMANNFTASPAMLGTVQNEIITALARG